MGDFASLALTRRSIRKYLDQDIPLANIEEIIRIATSAPSACNSQCWRFVAIKDKALLKEIENAVIKKFEDILSVSQSVLPENYIESKKRAVSFFSKAPVVIAVFMTPWEYFDPMIISVLEKQDYSTEELNRLFAYPDLLSIGAAIQNLLLAAHEKGYGACWMNDPAVAGEEIRQILKLNEENKFVSLIPIGLPAYSPREKRLKDLGDIFTEI